MPLNQRGRWPIVVVAVFACLFGVVVVSSVLRRSEDYSSYPQYSSLNNEAGGVKAYFNSLERLGYTVDRNYQTTTKLNGTTSTVFYIGISSTYFRELPEVDLAGLTNLADAGARLVIALDPKQVEWLGAAQSPIRKPVPKNAKKPVNSLEKAWGVRLERAPANDERFASEVGQGSAAGPGNAYIWYFAAWPQWAGSGAFGNTPLFLERKFGRGTIVLMANADLLSNRQLLTAPDVGALAAVAGTKSRVIFDENHLGVADTGSVARLAGAHRLQWLLLAFGILAVFYIWRNSISFVPPAAVDRDTAIIGRDAHRALQSLLRRSIPENEILGMAAAEWNRNWKLERKPGSRPLDEGELFQARAASGDEAIRLYREFSKRLNRTAKEG